MSACSVRLPVQLGVVDADGARIFSDEEVTEIKDAVTGWKQIEREALRGELEPSPTEEPPMIEEVNLSEVEAID